MRANNTDRYISIGDAVYDTVTGKTIHEGDPEWKPEWSAVNKQNADVIANQGQHATFDPNDTGDPNNFNLRTPKMVDNPGLWESAPLEWKIMVLGALGIAGGAAIAAASSSTAPAGVAEVVDAAGGVGATPEAVATAAAASGAADGGAGAFTVAGLDAATGDVAADALPALSSTTIGSGMATLPAGAATSMPGAGGASTLGTIGKALTTGQKVSNLLGAAGQGVGAATTAAGNNALDQEKLALEANGQNIQGQNAFVNQELGMAKEEAAQRKTALGDAYRASYAQNPRVSPFDPVGAPKLSSSYMAILNAMNDQASKKLTAPATYDTNNLPKPTPYTPVDIKNVQGATNTEPSTLQKIGNWVGPGLSIASKIASFV